MEIGTENVSSVPAFTLLYGLASGLAGLSSQEALSRSACVGPIAITSRKNAGAIGLFVTRFKSPISLNLIFVGDLDIFRGILRNRNVCRQDSARGSIGIDSERGIAAIDQYHTLRARSSPGLPDRWTVLGRVW